MGGYLQQLFKWHTLADSRLLPISTVMSLCSLPQSLSLSVCGLTVSLSLAIPRWPCVLCIYLFILSFFLLRTGQQNNSRYSWLIVDFSSGICWSELVKYRKLPVNANPVCGWQDVTIQLVTACPSFFSISFLLSVCVSVSVSVSVPVSLPLFHLSRTTTPLPTHIFLPPTLCSPLCLVWFNDNKIIITNV